MIFLNRRTFLKLCTLGVPGLVALFKVPTSSKSAFKRIAFPPENEYPKPLFSFNDDIDIGYYRVGDDKLGFSFGDSGTDIGGQSSDHIPLKAGGTKILTIK